MCACRILPPTQNVTRHATKRASTVSEVSSRAGGARLGGGIVKAAWLALELLLLLALPACS